MLEKISKYIAQKLLNAQLKREEKLKKELALEAARRYGRGVYLMNGLYESRAELSELMRQCVKPSFGEKILMGLVCLKHIFSRKSKTTQEAIPPHKINRHPTGQTPLINHQEKTRES